MILEGGIIMIQMVSLSRYVYICKISRHNACLSMDVGRCLRAGVLHYRRLYKSVNIVLVKAQCTTFVEKKSGGAAAPSAPLLPTAMCLSTSAGGQEDHNQITMCLLIVYKCGYIQDVNTIRTKGAC